MDSVLNKNKKSAYIVALGGIIPEFVYCSLAVYTANIFLSNPFVAVVFKILLIIILLIIAFLYLLKKRDNISLPIGNIHKSGNIKNFLKGLSLAMLNPQLLPFWILVQVYFNTISFLKLKTGFHIVSFILGAGLGAFLLLTLIIVTINNYKTTLLNYLNNKYYYKTLALVFLAIAIQQLITLL